MPIDFRTLLALCAFASVLMAVLLLAARASRPGDGSSKWTLGLAMMTLSLLVLAVPDVASGPFSQAAAGAAMLAGIAHQAAALAEFSGRKASKLLLYAPPALLFAALLALRDDFALFTLATAMGLVPSLGVVAWRIARLAGPGPRRLRGLVGATYALVALLEAVRALHIAHNPALRGSLLPADGYDTATFLALFAAIVTGSYGLAILQRARSEAEARRLAMLDELTDLPNRRAFFEMGERALALAAREGRPAAAMMLDLDHFKGINDVYGHMAGDRALAQFASVLRGALRTGDFAARYGGEEFCALLPGATCDEALDVAERIRRAVEQARLGGLPIAPTVSIGVTRVAVKSAGALGAALDCADQALSAAKTTGRNRVLAWPFAGPGELACKRAA